MGFLNTGFTGALGPLWVALELPEPDPDFEAALRRFGRERVIERHDRLEEMLDGSSWLVGDKHSLADGLLAGVARWLEYHEVADISRWPKLRALRQRVESDPAVVFATALEDGATPAGSGALKGHLPLAEVIARSCMLDRGSHDIHVPRISNRRLSMQVARWGNSLAIRIPAAVSEALALKEGDDVEVRIADDRTFLIARDERKPQALARIRALRKPLPAGWRFDRDEANERAP